MKNKKISLYVLFVVLAFMVGCARTPVLRDGQPIPGALVKAAGEGRYSAVLRLLDAGASSNEANKDGYTALMEAAFWCYDRVVRLLVDRGADVNRAVPFYGYTVLMIAAREGCTDTVKLLLEKGARIDQESMGGGTALADALSNGEAGTARFLLDKGANAEKAAASLRRSASWNKASKNGLALLEKLMREK